MRLASLPVLAAALAAGAAGAAAATAATTTVTLALPAAKGLAPGPATHATLASRGAHHAAALSARNAFVFGNVTAGSYLVDVHCASDAFAPLRVDVDDAGPGAGLVVRAWDTFRGNDWDNRGEAAARAEGGAVVVRWLGRKSYYVERPQFSVLGILKNPMILMGLVSMVLFIGMPYLMDSMDPEMRAEFEAQQRKGGLAALMTGGGGGDDGDGAQPPPRNPLGEFDMAAYLAGSGKKDSGGEGARRSSNQGVRR